MKRITKDEYYLDIAKAVCKRSTCLKRRYGCVIVKNDEIVSTGYNGSARGEKNCCDIGKCDRINEPSNSGNYANCPAVHAEQNAMLSAARNEMIGGIMYLYGEFFDTWSEEWSEIKDALPCPICERMMKNSGIVFFINKNERMLI